MKKHKTLQQQHQRSITTTYCAQKGCKFIGKEAQQGVCFHAKGELIDWQRVAQQETQILAELQGLRKAGPKAYVQGLEAHYVSAMINWQFTLDEVIRLRRDIALLNVKKPRKAKPA